MRFVFQTLHDFAWGCVNMSDPTPWTIDTTNGQLYGSIVHIFGPTLDWVNK